MNRWLIEFDIRTAKDQYVARHWLRDSRAQYLLRPEIDWPLSVDTLVWPSVFFSPLVSNPAFDSYSSIEVEPEVYRQLQLDLHRMRDYYDSHRVMAPDGVFVAVELLSERMAEGPTIPYEIPGGIQCAIWVEETVPARIPEGSTLLGYDVADAGRLSGLSNCGYTEEEVAALSPIWAKHLNSFGLFSSLENAVAFRELSDRRAVEHAPFWVYGLWQIAMR